MINDKDAEDIRQYLAMFSEQIYCQGKDRIVWSPMAQQNPFTAITVRDGKTIWSLCATLHEAIVAINATP